MVVRYFDQEFVLHSVNSGTETTMKVLTILNRNGEQKASLEVGYDRNSSVKIRQITIYDKSGKKVKTLKQSEINDSPAFADFLLYSDNRVISYYPVFPEYPCTIEYDYEISFNNQISFGRWMPLDDYNVSVQDARLSVTYPAGIKINRREFNVPAGSSETLKGMTTDSWELKNIMAIEDEPFDEAISERSSSVYLMPSVLEYDKFIGTSDTWRNYGAWTGMLYSGRDKLPDEAVQKIMALIMNKPDTLERIKILYRYLQENTMYVAIKMGLGGYQPFDAETVYRTGYGDCKALSNYMEAILRLAGIRSYPALVSSGRYINQIFNDFPNFRQFDHVILCVPFRKDTIWLECTSQEVPFGFLGDFTDDRQVLLITENGGVFAHTPRYGANENSRRCTSCFRIDSSGTAKCSMKTIYKGLQYDEVGSLLISNNDEQKKWLYKNSSFPSMQITGFLIVNYKSMMPEADIDVSFSSTNYGSISGKYMLLPLNMEDVQKSIPKMLKQRHSDIVVNRSFNDYDSLVYVLPSEFRLESLPKGISLTSCFGSYSFSVVPDGEKIIVVRKFTVNQGRFKPAQYGDLYNFIQSVSKGDNIKVLLSM
jgi:transglutaminase-like putative cysteine protease